MKRPLEVSMKDFAEAIKSRQNNKFDCNIAIDGPRGNGKSTFTVKLFSRWKGFRMKRDIVFSREDVMNKMEHDRFGLIDADEMINSAHNRDFFSGDQNTMIKMLNMYRDNCNVLAGCVPFFYDLDKQVRKLIKIRVTIIERGVAVIQMAKNSLYSNDPWDTDYNSKLERKWEEKAKAGCKFKPPYHKLSTFAGYLYFGDLRSKQRILYEKVKQEKRARLRVEQKEGEESNGGKSRESIFYDKALEMVKDGRMNQLMFYAACQASGYKITSVLTAMNRKLKDSGSTFTIGQLFKRQVKNNSNLITPCEGEQPKNLILNLKALNGD